MTLSDIYHWDCPTESWEPDDDSDLIYRYRGDDNADTLGRWTVERRYPESGEDDEEIASFTMFGFGPADQHDRRERFTVVPVGEGEFTVCPPFGTQFDLTPRRDAPRDDLTWETHSQHYTNRFHDTEDLDAGADASYSASHELSGGFDVLLSLRRRGRGRSMNLSLHHPEFSRPVSLGSKFDVPVCRGHTDGYYRACDDAREDADLVVTIPGVGEQSFEYLPDYTAHIRSTGSRD